MVLLYLAAKKPPCKFISLHKQPAHQVDQINTPQSYHQVAMYDQPYHHRNRPAPNHQNFLSFRATSKSTPISAPFTKLNSTPTTLYLDPHEVSTTLVILDDVFTQLQNVTDEVEKLTPIDIPAPYQITRNYASKESNDRNERDVAPREFKQVSTPIRYATSTSRPVTGTATALPQPPPLRHNGISFKSEFYKLLGHYNSLMQQVLAKNNDINILKYKLNQSVNTLVLELGNLHPMEQDNEYNDMRKEDNEHELGGGTTINEQSTAAKNQSLGPSEYNFQRKMDEISKKLMEIFNPQEEFESVSVDSTTIDSYILHKKKNKKKVKS